MIRPHSTIPMRFARLGALGFTGIVALLCTALPVTAANAADPAGQATLNARQIRVCMGKHMSSNRSVSYNEAKRVCADRLKAQNQLASTPPGSVGAGGGK